MKVAKLILNDIFTNKKYWTKKQNIEIRTKSSETDIERCQSKQIKLMKKKQRVMQWLKYSEIEQKLRKRTSEQTKQNQQITKGDKRNETTQKST